MTWTGFLGAFNDNVYQQLVLLTVIGMSAATSSDGASGSAVSDGQWSSMFVFAVPFVFLSGFAGVLSDRNDKRTIVILTKWAEIFCMGLGLLAFLVVPWIGAIGLNIVLFLMTAQSAFYGPAKYGILPEMLRERDLPQATSLTLLFTFLAIIFGTALAGPLLQAFPGRVWIAQIACILIAIIGTATAYLVRPVPVAQPGLEFAWKDWAVPADTLDLLWRDRSLLWGVLASCMFWSAGVVVKMAVNAYGKIQLQLDDTGTSLLAAAVAVGIMLGSVVAGFFPERTWGARLVTTGAWGIALLLAALACFGQSLETLPSPGEVARLEEVAKAGIASAAEADVATWISLQNARQVGLWGAFPLLLLLGGATGIFIVPIQVYLQARPPDEQKGRMIAAQAFFNWVAMSLSAFLYLGMEFTIYGLAWPRSAVFGLTALLIVPLALFYTLPPDEDLGEA